MMAQTVAVISKSGRKFWVLSDDSGIFVSVSGFWDLSSQLIVNEAMNASGLTHTRTYKRITEEGIRMSGIGFNYPSDDVKPETLEHVIKVLEDYNPQYKD